MLWIWIALVSVLVVVLLIFALWDMKRKTEPPTFTGYTVYIQDGPGPDLTRQPRVEKEQSIIKEVIANDLADRRRQFWEAKQKIEPEKLDVYVADEDLESEKLDVFILSADDSKLDKFGEESTEENIVV